MGIEAVIGHLKSDHRLGRNFLSGFLGDEINVLMAAAAFNFKKWLREKYFFAGAILRIVYWRCHFGALWLNVKGMREKLQGIWKLP